MLTSTGNERKFQDPEDLLEHALDSSRPSQSFVNELFKYLAKQSPSSFDKVETNELSKILKNNQLSIPDLYWQLGYQAAIYGMSWKNNPSMNLDPINRRAALRKSGFPPFLCPSSHRQILFWGSRVARILPSKDW